MKKNLILIITPVVILALLVLFAPQFLNNTVRAEKPTTEFSRQEPITPETQPNVPLQNSKAEQLISYAMSLKGTPYIYAGMSPDGFDCSGFTAHVFDAYGIDIPHSSRMQADEGLNVSREEAQPGDLVIFTGTNAAVREPGHVGIVISEPGDTIAFVHSSSNGGVKVSKVEGTRYNERFLEIRRVL
ncbi:C40 family peptidase [Pontibacter oryzae]|uniref:NlpC/P60 family protein n=1 Tax=Pontibacter oryzae TaxID=2304593 RepID=A0A399SFD2_9BACT|nr:C40 family peptidase [Pontibacter oryzae]RIJ41861.1 NlpC/P60 family protein [Pontibacter oryzae]